MKIKLKTADQLKDKIKSPSTAVGVKPNAHHQALLYEAFADGSVRCDFCAHLCRIEEGKKGVFQVRQNLGGTLYTLVYGCTISQHVDPVEKNSSITSTQVPQPTPLLHRVANFAADGARIGKFHRCHASST